MIATDPGDRVTFLNSAAEQQYRVRSADVLGRNLSELYTRQWPSPESEAAAWAALEERGHWCGEKLHRTRDGRELPVESSIAILHDPITGGRSGLITAIRDITGRREAEAALRLTNERLTLAVKCSQVVLFQQDLELRYIWHRNPELGLKVSDFVGQRDADLMERAGDAAVTEALKREVIRSGISQRQEVLVHIQGVDRHYDLLVEPQRDAAGCISGVTCAAIDITGRKQMEEALRESEDRMQQALRVSGSFTFDWCQETDRVRRSASAGAILHLAGEEAVSDTAQGYLQRIHPGDRERCVALLTSLREGARDYTVNYRVVRADGVAVSLEEVGRGSFDAAGKLVRLEGVATDVTKRRQAEAALREATEKAVAANAAKDRFLAALSHELRTPLTPVLLVAEVRARSEAVSKNLREDFAMIHRNIVLEAQLIDDLLDVSRIQQGKMRFVFKPVDVHEAIARTLEMLRSELEEKGIAVRQELGAASAALEADPTRIQQVLSNLLRNAVKFTPRGGTITVRTTRDQSALQISIADTGAGIAAEDLERIFQPFEQVDAQQKSEHRSLGLGLAISSVIVTAHHGRLWAESPAPGQGSTFHVRLPF